MDAFDADVLIYAAVPGHALGEPVRALIEAEQASSAVTSMGSVLLLPELLSKPTRDGATDEVDVLISLLGRLELVGLDEAIAALAVELGASHRLRAADSVHLATAVAMGAERFITNNRRDFGGHIDEIEVVHPDAL